MTRREFSPALAASFLLHGGAALLLSLSWQSSRDLKVGAAVPVNIVANAPATDLRAAVEAPEIETAATEEPVPDAPLEVAPPAPTPQPLPPTPKPAVKAAEKAAVKPAPTPKPAEKGLDLDALAASLSKSRPSGARPSSAPKGPSRPETAAQARAALGSGEAAAAMSGLADELQRRWNPNCEVEGGRDVLLRVTFTLGSGGQVVGQVAPQIRSAPGPVAQAAAERAVRAVYAASPFRDLPRQFYGDRIAVNFNAREACS